MRTRSGALLGAWLVGNLMAYRLLVRSGWPFGAEAPAEIRVDVFDSLPSWLTATIVVLSFIAPIVLVAVWRQLERRTGIDHDSVVMACRWWVGAFRTPASVGVAAAVVCLLTLPAFHDAFWFAALPAIVMVLLLPFGVFDPRVAASPAPDGWWRLRWPGLRPVLKVVAVLGVAGVVEVAGTAVAEAFPPLTPAVVAGEMIVAAIAVALIASILLFKATPARLRSPLSWQRLGPIVAVHARVMFVAAFFAAPVVVAAMLLWKLVPLHAAWAEARGALLPWSARTLIALASALETSGILIGSFVLGLPLFLMVARILWVTSDSSREPRGALRAW